MWGTCTSFRLLAGFFSSSGQLAGDRGQTHWWHSTDSRQQAARAPTGVDAGEHLHQGRQQLGVVGITPAAVQQESEAVEIQQVAQRLPPVHTQQRHETHAAGGAAAAATGGRACSHGRHLFRCLMRRSSEGPARRLAALIPSSQKHDRRECLRGRCKGLWR